MKIDQLEQRIDALNDKLAETLDRIDALENEVVELSEAAGRAFTPHVLED